MLIDIPYVLLFTQMFYMYICKQKNQNKHKNSQPHHITIS